MSLISGKPIRDQLKPEFNLNLSQEMFCVLGRAVVLSTLLIGKPCFPSIRFNFLLIKDGKGRLCSRLACNFIIFFIIKKNKPFGLLRLKDTLESHSKDCEPACTRRTYSGQLLQALRF
jgi:hypothetical protein